MYHWKPASHWKPAYEHTYGSSVTLRLPIATTLILLSPLLATFAFFRRRKRLKAISPSPLSRICPGCSYEFPAQQPQCPECGVAAKSEEATAIRH
jgi:hypothetical protein